MRKGTTEIIVVITLLMTAVSLAGTSFVFMTQSQEQSKMEAQQTGMESLKKSGSCLEILSFDDKTNNLRVRNCGKYPLENVTVFIDNNPISSVALNAKPNEAKVLGIGASSGVHEIMVAGDYVSATTSINVVNKGIFETMQNAMIFTEQDEFDFSVVLSPAEGSVIQGSGVSVSVGTALMKGVSRIISLSCSGLPAGASCSFGTSSINATDGVSTLKISTDLATPAGEYPVTITGLAGGGASRIVIYGLTIEAELTPPSVSVSGAPAKWQSADAVASITCNDSESGCDAKTYKIKEYFASGSCPDDYGEYALPDPSAISSHVWICGAAKDKAGNAGFSAPAEFRIDKVPPAMDCDNPSYFYISPGNPTDYDKITVAALATDDIGISKIQIFADGAIIQTCAAYAGMNSLACSKSAGAYGAGSFHAFAAKAYDSAGNAAECKKTLPIASLSAECKAAIGGQQCGMGDLGKTIVCGCVQYACY